MIEPSRTVAARLNTLIKESSPSLVPRARYGMLAYSLGAAVLCFLRSGQMSKSAT